MQQWGWSGGGDLKVENLKEKINSFTPKFFFRAKIIFCQKVTNPNKTCIEKKKKIKLKGDEK